MAVLLTGMPAFACAGGFFLAGSDMAIRQPDQRAVIAWDGERQEMVLFSGFVPDDISNFAWVIPVKSRKKPEVAACDTQFFNCLSGIFRGKKKFLTREPGLLGKKITVSSKREFYSITVLEPGQGVMGWLSGRGYVLSRKAVNVMEDYLKEIDMYFLINEIRLGDKYADEIKQVNEIYDNAKKEYNEIAANIWGLFSKGPFVDRRYKGKKIQDVMINYLKTWNPRQAREKPGFYWLEDYFNRITESEFRKRGLSGTFVYVLNDDTLRIEGNPRLKLSMVDGRPEPVITYDFKIMKYSWKKGEFSLKGYSVEKNTIYFPDNSLSKYRGEVSKYAGARALTENDSEDLLRFFSPDGYDYSGFIKKIDERVKIFRDVILTDVESVLGENLSGLTALFHKIESYNNKPQVYVKKFYDPDYNAGFKEKVRSLVNSSSISVEAKKKFCELEKEITGLERGTNTPLLISFAAEEPYYPLKSSVINGGECRIEVYFISGGDVTDRRAVLFKDKKVVKIDEKTAQAIKGNFEIRNADRISWFYQSNKFENLLSDVFFNVKRGN